MGTIGIVLWSFCIIKQFKIAIKITPKRDEGDLP